MVRVFLKGGVWKNSEDEILKAAVQKYGKQQWARVASLLNRKTAKQAKARWHEWLDPSIRKTEWSRPEEEKLLHLAKLLPAQWKTIAPLVGRTAVQCQEHYELVLDQAATATSTPNDTDETLRQHAAASLRPGQIDSHPESKPAKPDPMDMDEDEMEMLQEARARLANTQGKKAKRKQRERILAAAKRLADLQKRRELKQAGLLSARARTKSKTRKKEIDFGVEIPFYKPAPAGFHAVAGEDARAKDLQRKRLASVNFKKVNENQYRTRDRDAAAAKRREESRLRVLEESNEKYASAKSKTVEDELPATTFRNSLQLPAPMEVDEDDVVQGKQRSMPTPPTAGTAATQTLLGDYSSRPLPTPMRQPTATVVDLNRQATQLRQLERGQTPLLATATRMEEPPMNNGMDDDDDDANDMDRKLPARPTTPGGRSTAVGRTPIRDPLGLNASSASVASQYTQPQSQPSQWPAGADDHSVSGSTLASMSIRDLARQERRAAKRARADLEAALAALPAPQFEYELTAPGPDPDDAVGDMLVETVEEDAADIEAATLEDQRRQAQLEYEARNSVVKRMELPRPTGRSDRNDFVVLPTIDTNTDNTTVSRMIEDEMQTLLQHDAVAFPIVVDKKKKKKRKLMEDAVPQLTKEAVVVLDVIPADHLETARTMIQAELEVVLDEKIALVLRDGKATTRDDALEFLCHENARVSQEGAIDQAYRTDQGWVRAESDQDRIASLRDEYECLEQATAALKKKHDKAAAKLSVTTGGYAKRATKLTKDTLEAFADLDKSRIEESVYRMLQSQEIQGGTNRIEELERDIVALRASEAKLQARYGELAMAERRKKMVAANSKQ